MSRTGDETFGSQRSSIEVSDVLCQLLKQQSAPDVDIYVFDGNLLNFKYFMTFFREVVESAAKCSLVVCFRLLAMAEVISLQ